MLDAEFSGGVPQHCFLGGRGLLNATAQRFFFGLQGSFPRGGELSFEEGGWPANNYLICVDSVCSPTAGGACVGVVCRPAFNRGLLHAATSKNHPALKGQKGIPRPTVGQCQEGFPGLLEPPRPPNGGHCLAPTLTAALGKSLHVAYT